MQKCARNTALREDASIHHTAQQPAIGNKRGQQSPAAEGYVQEYATENITPIMGARIQHTARQPATGKEGGTAQSLA